MKALLLAGILAVTGTGNPFERTPRIEYVSVKESFFAMRNQEYVKWIPYFRGALAGLSEEEKQQFSQELIGAQNTHDIDGDGRNDLVLTITRNDLIPRNYRFARDDNNVTIEPQPSGMGYRSSDTLRKEDRDLLTMRTTEWFIIYAMESRAYACTAPGHWQGKLLDLKENRKRTQATLQVEIDGKGKKVECTKLEHAFR